MYVNYHSNRNEFLDKFKQNRAKNENDNPYMINKKTQNKTSKAAISENKIKNSESLSNRNNNFKNLGMEGRWDYLYELEKFKRAKLDEKRKIKENELFEKDLTECTFSPKLNKFRNLKNHFNSNSKFLSSSYLEKENNSGMALPTDENLNSKIYSGNMIERQQWWEYKKKIKIENLRNNENSKNIKECVFRPKLNSPGSLKKLEIDQDATNMLVDPESYYTFVNRRQKFRSEKENLHKRQKSTPGCGRIWTNKITKPEEFKIKKEDGDYTGNINVKSLQKPINHEKFTNLKNNYKKGDTKESKTNKRNLSDIVYSTKEDLHYDDLFVDRNKPLNNKFEDKVDFAYAMKQLHDELYSINLMKAEY